MKDLYFVKCERQRVNELSERRRVRFSIDEKCERKEKSALFGAIRESQCAGKCVCVCQGFQGNFYLFAVIRKNRPFSGPPKKKNVRTSFATEYGPN